MLGRLDAAGIVVKPVRTNGAWGIENPSSNAHTPEQKEVVRDALLFAIGHPRCFATMCRLINERDASNVA